MDSKLGILLELSLIVLATLAIVQHKRVPNWMQPDFAEQIKYILPSLLED